MKKLAFLMLVLVAGTSIAVAVKAGQSNAKVVAYCHCEPDWTCNSTGAWGIKTQICP
ncbi:hypothetical protein [Chitinophaga sancti]|uniref:Natural product n=1 Tax=Chitinophaga sancti TaxID=1004 RepID=A0A1K1NFY7_9BACT|nr:hypothetical protein [Chitinophaga sancti]WQD63250.1 hypothetical protein U0033_02505 [Chitinophaga sancti]WQG91124.1 hypothetical protein SR876_06410 [Chitinophaga sancti]SFW34231.1 hypothetical protein SAMN05661012_01281 [Chitinophaga sancti]